MLNLSVLNEQQRAAVEARFGNVLVLAGAGSGKTRVLTYRIAHLLEQKLVKPEHVLALTFTNKAAREMSERIDALLGGPVLSHSGGFVGTFHKLGVLLLRVYGEVVGVSPTFTIVDSDDRAKLIKDLLAEQGVGEEVHPRSVAHAIHSMKNSLLSSAEATAHLPAHVSGVYLQAIESYERVLRKYGLVDLDDLIYLPLQIFSRSSQALEQCKLKFQAVFVDEYQDTNPAQYRMLKYLCPPAPLFVVGDDAQSIYGFRGSDVGNIFSFEKDFEGAEVFALEQNYRSTGSILEVAEKVITHSTNQMPKKLWTEAGMGEKVKVKELMDENAEAVYIANSIVGELHKDSEDGNQEELQVVEEEEAAPFSILDYLLKNRQGGLARGSMVKKLLTGFGRLGEFVVLYRTHAQTRALETAFVAAGIPYRIYGGLRFFERKEIKDALAYLRVLQNPKDLTAWSRVFSTPSKGLGPKALEVFAGILDKAKLQDATKLEFWQELEKMLSQEGGGRSSAGLQKLIHIFAKSVKEDSGTFSVWLRGILKNSGLLDFYSKEEFALEERKENLLELVNLTQSYAEESWPLGLARLLEEAALLGEADGIDENAAAVSMMTLHASKGLEFDQVFFAGLEEGVLPHSRSFASSREMDEESRLAYVGMTRARKRLHLTFARYRGVYGSRQQQTPSRFLKDLPTRAVQWVGRRPVSIDLGDVETGGLSYEPWDE